MALTNAELFEHFGRSIFHGIDNGFFSKELIPTIIKTLASYRKDSRYTDLTTRTEAAKEIYKNLFSSTGRNPVADLHYLKHHFLEDIVNNEGDII